MPAPAPTESPGFAGSWFTTFGKLRVEPPAGRDVEGAYTHKGGRIQGALEGCVLRGAWVEPEHGRRGVFELHLDERGNTFRGSWRDDGDAAWRGAWDGVRLELPAEEEGGSPGGWNSHAEGPLLAGPMLGEVGEAEARVWVQARDAGPISIVARSPDGDEIRASATPSWDAWRCAVLHVEGLRPGVGYTYEIEGPGGRVGPYPLRLAPPRDARRARIAFGSCFWDYPNPDLTIFDAIARESSDCFLMVGDNSYFAEPDWQSEHTMMLAHLRHRNNEPIRRLLPTTPTLGVWDDHDFGPNDADSRFEGKDMALRAYQRCWVQATFGTDDVPGVFSSVRVGPVEVFLLDSRYYRSDPEAVLLGADQLDWLLEALAASDAPVKVIASPTQLLPELAVTKGWACFRRDAPRELEQILGEIEAQDVRGVVFVSGDLHMSNLLFQPGRAVAGGTGPDFWELTASPLANDPWKEPAAGTDPFILQEVADRVSYGVVDVDLDRAGAEVILLLKGAEGEPLMEQAVDLSALQVR